MRRIAFASGLALPLLVAAAFPAAAQEWIQLSPSGGPPPGRQNPTGVYDPGTNRLVIFGGFFTPSFTSFNDVWVLSDANGLGTPTWTSLIVQGAAGSPPARAAHVAVYDELNNRMIVFGGSPGTGPLFNDVWVLANANGLGGPPMWTKLFPAGTPPPPLIRSAAVYDKVNNRMIIFSGSAPLGNVNDVWVLTHANGIGGTPQWIKLIVSGSSPSPREGASAVYDTANNRMIIFGGSTNDVWVLSNANGLGGTPIWTELIPDAAPGSPSVRNQLQATYDQSTNRMTIFGGHAGINFNDVWVLSNANGLGGPATWTQLIANDVSGSPSRRCCLAGGYDPASNRLTIFGGFPEWLNDTWVLTNATGVVTVQIDIKPGSFPNSINLGSGGTVPIAIFSTNTFDATTVDPTTVTLAGAEVKLRGNGMSMASVQDVNDDGLLDLVVHVSTEAFQLSETDTEAVLEGQTFSGTPIRGTDSVRVVP